MKTVFFDRDQIEKSSDPTEFGELFACVSPVGIRYCEVCCIMHFHVVFRFFSLESSNKHWGLRPKSGLIVGTTTVQETNGDYKVMPHT